MSLAKTLSDLERLRDSIGDSVTKSEAKAKAERVAKILGNGLADFADDLTEHISQVSGAGENVLDYLDDKDERDTAIDDLGSALDDLIVVLRDNV